MGGGPGGGFLGGIRMIRMQGIRKEYHGRFRVGALDGVDIHIKPHEFVSIIGPSGSIGSTLMNIIGCLIRRTRHYITSTGQEIDDYSEDELADIRGRKIGFIFQQFNLLPKLTAQENVELPLIYQGMSASKRHARSEEVLKRVGLLDRMDHKPTELSGGQQQRRDCAGAGGIPRCCWRTDSTATSIRAPADGCACSTSCTRRQHHRAHRTTRRSPRRPARHPHPRQACSNRRMKTRW